MTLLLKHFHDFPSHLAPTISSWSWPRRSCMLSPLLSLFLTSSAAGVPFACSTQPTPASSLLLDHAELVSFRVFAFALHLPGTVSPDLQMFCLFHLIPTHHLCLSLCCKIDLYKLYLPASLANWFPVKFAEWETFVFWGRGSGEEERWRGRIQEISPLFSILGNISSNHRIFSMVPAFAKWPWPPGFFSLFFSLRVNCKSLGCRIVTCLLFKHF